MALEYLHPGAQQVLKPGMSPYEQATTLQQHQMPHEAIKSLAHGMPEHKSVKWATASAEKVSNPDHASDVKAIHAAKAWSANPTPANQELAAKAAAHAGHSTPGAWAAQSAASAGKGGGLSAHAASGSVMLAAAQGGKPIPSSGPSIPAAPAAPKVAAPEPPKKPAFKLPLFSKPTPPAQPAPPAPQEPVKGPDGLTLTPAQRTQLTKSTDPFIKMGCDIGQAG